MYKKVYMSVKITSSLSVASCMYPPHLHLGCTTVVGCQVSEPCPLILPVGDQIPLAVDQWLQRVAHEARAYVESKYSSQSGMIPISARIPYL